MEKVEPPVLNDQEKKEMKKVIIAAVQDMADAYTVTAKELSKTEEIDEDDDVGTYEAIHYPRAMYFYLHLCNPDWITYNVYDFWDQDTGPRAYTYNMLEKHLSSELFAKIDTYMMAANKKGTGHFRVDWS